jgi:glycosyltransferase involved in cell wall biosynthesis
MRILHLNVLYPPFDAGGSERFVACLAQEQAKRGHDVGVVTLSRQPSETAIEEGVTVHRIGHGNIFWFEDWAQHSAPARYLNKLLTNWNPVTLNRVRAAVATFKPDVINTHCMLSFATDSWKAGYERQIPIVHTLHEFNLICRNTTAFRNGKMCESICPGCWHNIPKRWMASMVSAVNGVSEDTLQRHLDLGYFAHIPRELRRVIWSMPPIGIKSRAAAASDRPFTLGYIGRIVPEKGIDVLLSAVDRLKGNNWELLVAGTAAPPLDIAELSQRASHLPVKFLGSVKAEDFYPRIDVLVVPALWAEPGPLVVAEAFANAVPVVGSRMGGIRDKVEDGKTGWLFEPHDVDALTAILERLIAEGRAALPPQQNFVAFQQTTTPDQVSVHYENLYTAAIAAAARPIRPLATGRAGASAGS